MAPRPRRGRSAGAPRQPPTVEPVEATGGPRAFKWGGPEERPGTIGGSAQSSSSRGPTHFDRSRRAELLEGCKHLVSVWREIRDFAGARNSRFR